MKIVTLLFLSIASLCHAQTFNDGLENSNLLNSGDGGAFWFDSAPEGGFDSEVSGIKWGYTQARNSSVVITGSKSIELRSGTFGDIRSTTNIPEGLDAISFNAVQRFDGGGDRTFRIEIYNATGTEIKRATQTYTLQTAPFTPQLISFTDLAITEECSIRIRNASGGGNDIVIDDLTWAVSPPILSMDEFNIEAGTVYPNPIVNNLNIQLRNNDPFEISIYNLVGAEIIKTKTYVSNASIPTDSLISGLYILEIRTKEKKYNKKIMKR